MLICRSVRFGAAESTIVPDLALPNLMSAFAETLLHMYQARPMTYNTTPGCSLKPSILAIARITDTSHRAPARAVAPLLYGPFLDEAVSICDMRCIY